VLGFLIGIYGTNLIMNRSRRGVHNLAIGGDTIMTKRSQVIKQAFREGKNTYEFEVAGPHPILNK